MVGTFVRLVPSALVLYSGPLGPLVAGHGSHIKEVLRANLYRSKKTDGKEGKWAEGMMRFLMEEEQPHRCTWTSFKKAIGPARI